MGYRFSQKLVNKEMMQEYEKNQIPYQVIGNMLLSIREILDENDSQLKWRDVTEDQIEKMGETFESLLANAFEADETHGFVRKSLLEQIGNNPMLSKQKADKYKTMGEKDQIWILSNYENVHGATVWRHPAFLKKVAEELHTKRLAIAPISTHYVLVADANAPKKTLRMLQATLNDSTKTEKSLGTELIYWFETK